MSAKRLYLIRHAQPDYPNGAKMCLGRKNDLPLSAYGFAQAQALRRYFAPLGLEAVYSSPLLRARQTAAAIAENGCPLHVLDDLIELDGGEWDGLSFDELHRRYPAYFGSGIQRSCPPGGETDEQGLARTYAALARIEASTEKCAAIVAHSGINRILLCDLLGRPLREKKRLPQECGAVNVLEYENGIWRATEVNLQPAQI